MPDNTARPFNTPRQVLFASLIGTTIEFFDFYIYATAAVLVFPRLFFPASDPASATLASLATFAIAFLARPARLGPVRPFRRSHRAQGDAGRRAADDGRVDGRDRAAADLRVDRHRGAAAAGAVPVRAGPGARRRMGRRGPAGGRERAAGKARLVRHVPAAGRAPGVLLFRERVPAAVAAAQRRPVLPLRVADSRSSPARRWWSSDSTCG